MDFGKAFTFAFDDPDWLKKIALAALVSLIPIVGAFVLAGWAMDTARRVIRQDPTPLADLDFGQQLELGFKTFVIGLVYSLPFLLIWVPPVFSMFIVDDYGQSYPWLVIPSFVCCGGLATLYGLLIWVLLPAAQGRFLASGRLGAAFEFGKVFELVRRNPGAYLLVLLGGVVASFIAPIGGFAFAIGAIFTGAYAALITAHLTGQAFREAAPEI